MSQLASPVSPEAQELLHFHRIAQERHGNLPNSIQSRQVHLYALARWLAPLGLLEATRQDIERFLDKRRTRDGHKISSRTRRCWIVHLHAFYAWGLSENLTDSDPTVAIVRPTSRRTLPRPIDRADLDFAIRAARPQMRAMLSLAAFGGLRVQEIAGLERDDIIDSKSLVRVRHGKGDNERVIPLHLETMTALQRLPMPERGIIFRRPSGVRHWPATLSLEISRYLHGLDIDATAHQCRHFFATEIYANTHDLRLTQQLLGHAHSQTTAGYVAWSPANAAAAIGSLKVNAKRTTRAQPPAPCG
jgi:site-specific recombinase XerD